MESVGGNCFGRRAVAGMCCQIVVAVGVVVASGQMVAIGAAGPVEQCTVWLTPLFDLVWVVGCHVDEW